jgi:exosortase family protein XrtF
VLNAFGFDSRIEQHPDELSFKQIINDRYVARIVEGCNAVSIIILFIAFVVAFATKFKPTFVFILLGSLILYVTNIFRIALISILLIEIPEYQHIVHDFVFPGIIYGMTFILWIIWIKKYAGLKK